MAKATKSRKPGKGGRKPATGKPAGGKKKVAKKVVAKAGGAGKASTKKASTPVKKPASPPARSVAVATKPAREAAAQPIKTGTAAAVLARPERPVARPAPAPRAPALDQQPAESDTPPALPVPIASFTF